MNCRSFKCLSRYNRSTVRNYILAKSHQNSLIDQTCRLSIKCQMCLCSPRCLWMLIDATIGFDQHSHTHSLSLSLSLCYLAFFPHRFLPFINSLCDCVCINWNIDFTVLGCSHFKGNTSTKSFYYCIIKWVTSFKFILLAKIDLQNTQTLQLN